MRYCLIGYLASIIVGCQLIQSIPQHVEVERTFAELSLAEKYTYLRAVLRAQVIAIRNTRIERVKSHSEKITHHVTLTANRIDDGPGNAKLLRVHWGTVQADSIELLRCQQDIIPDGTAPSSNDTIKPTNNFDKLQSNPRGHGFLACSRVYGLVKDDGVIDYRAENGYKYVYFFRPCFKNYVLAAPAKSTDTDKQCGEEKIKAAEDAQETLEQADKLTLVYRYCQTDARQVCSEVVTRSNSIFFNQGERKLPKELYEERDKLIAEIKKHDDKVWELSGVVLAELSDYDPLEQELKKQEGLGKRITELQKTHEEENDRRRQKAEAIAGYTDIVHQVTMGDRLGTEMSFGSRNCYGEMKDVQAAMEISPEDLAGDPVLEELNAYYGDGSDDQEMFGTDFFDDKEIRQAKNVASGLIVGECLYHSAKEVNKLVGINPLKRKEFGKSTDLAKNMSNTDLSLAATNVTVGLIPMQNSELNKSGSTDAFVDALNGIFMGADTYIKSHCKACLDYLAKVRRHSRMLSQLKKELVLLNARINEELTKKGATDPP